MNMKTVVKRAVVAIAVLMVTTLLALIVFICVAMERAKSYQIRDRVQSSPKGGMFVAGGDTRIFVQRTGGIDAPTVVFIHGTGSWSETWRASIEQAAKLGYQAIAIDMPPFGYSLPPASGNYSKPQQAKRLLAALDSLGVRQATFVAHSFGAAPVMEALMVEPERAASLVLVDAALGLGGAQTDGSDNAAQRLLRERWLSRSISAAFLTNPNFTGTLLRSFISEKEKATAHWIDLYRQPLTLSGSYQGIASWLPELLADRGLARSDDVNAYTQLRVPVTLIWGETDAITPLHQATFLQQLIPRAKLIVVPKAGHIPQIEEPQAFRSALAQALANK